MKVHSINIGPLCFLDRTKVPHSVQRAAITTVLRAPGKSFKVKHLKDKPWDAVGDAAPSELNASSQTYLVSVLTTCRLRISKKHRSRLSPPARVKSYHGLDHLECESLCIALAQLTAKHEAPLH